MILKNSIYTLTFAAMISMMAMNAGEASAQGKASKTHTETFPVVAAQKGDKAFTLEDLNFGGNNYRNMVAKNRWCTWWGDELVRQDINACYLVNKATGKETKLFSIDQINQWIAPTKDIKVRALYNAQFPFEGKSIVMVSNGSKLFTIDFKKHKLISEMEYAEGESLLEANAQQNAFAYLKGSNLYVRTFNVANYNAMTKDKKSLVPTDLGFIVIDMMQHYFKEIVDTGFTAQMEENLDDIEAKGVRWKSVIEDFYGDFKKELDVAEEEIQKVEFEVELTGETCEKCGKPMAVKHGRFGAFAACTGYPECKNTKPIVQSVDVKCPKCGKDIVMRRSKRGRVFYGCSGYPDCTQSYWNKPVDKKCPKCGSLLVEKKTKEHKYACSNSECDYKE